MLDAMHTELSDDYTAFNTVSATDDTVFLATKATKNNNFIYVKNNMLNACPKDLSIDILEREVIGCDTTATSAFIPEYVYHVGESAFMNCTALTSVSSVNETLDISESAFYGCTSLDGINLPDSFYLSAVPAYAFYDCYKLNNIRILSNASYVGEFAFAHCTSLSSAQDINAAEKSNYTLSALGDNAFDGCISLSSFFIPHNISSLGDSVFKGCTSLKRVEIDLDAQDFLNVVGKSDVISSVNEAVKTKFSNINEDAKCAIVFNDAVYMNDGTVKVDDEYVTITSKDSISSVEAFNYEMFADSSMTYLNLSNVTNVN